MEVLDIVSLNPGITWGGFALATIFVASRFWLRFRSFRKFYIDDVFVLTAWLMVLASSITWQFVAKDMFLNNAVSRGAQPPPPDFATRSEVFLKAAAAIILLFNSTLWCIKLSFLFFFRRLYVNVGRWMRFWWVVFVVTMACCIVCLGDQEYKCLVKPLEEVEPHCSGDSNVRFQVTIMILNCVLDTFTDALITCIPIAILWKVRISTRRKLALGGLFGATVFTIVIAITRISLLTSKSWHRDMTWLYLWSNVECYAALIVSSLGSFRSLFRTQDSEKKPSTPSDEPPYTIGSPPKKRRLGDFGHLFTTSLNKSAYDSGSQHALFALEGPSAQKSVSVASTHRDGSVETCRVGQV